MATRGAHREEARLDDQGSEEENEGGEAIALAPSADTLDRRLVERASARLAEIASSLKKSFVEMGEYLLEAFYANDPKQYAARGPGRHVTLAAVLARCESFEVPFSRSMLSASLRVAAIAVQLPRGAAYRKLPRMHQELLAALGDPVAIEKLAERALRTKMTAAKLRALLDHAKGADDADESGADDDEKKARARAAAVPRTVERLAQTLRDERGRLAFRSADVRRMSTDERNRTRSAIEDIQRRLHELEALLRTGN